MIPQKTVTPRLICVQMDYLSVGFVGNSLNKGSQE